MVQEAEATAVRLLASALWVVAAVVAVVRRQVVRVVLACTHVMAVLGLVLVEVFPLQTLLMLVVQAVHDLARQPEPLAVQAARPGQPEPLVLHLLPVGCLGKAAVAEAVALLVQVEQVVRAVVAQAVVAVVQHAVHMPLAPVV